MPNAFVTIGDLLKDEASTGNRVDIPAPADMNATVNTKALPYYASREKLLHDKGWSLHAQTNPLPVALRPLALATLKI